MATFRHQPVVFGVGVDNLNKLASDLRRAADKEIIAEIRVAFQAGGNLVRDAAKSNFGWSTRIPGTVRTFMPFGNINKVQVKAGGAKAPHAAAYEHGGESGFFRHPVFGNRDVWVEEAARPSLFPALESNIENVLDRVMQGIDRAFVSIGAR